MRAIVRTAQGMFRPAGRDDLAERFRPLPQRVTRKVRETEGETAGQTEAAASAASGEAESAEVSEKETSTEKTA